MFGSHVMWLSCIFHYSGLAKRARDTVLNPVRSRATASLSEERELRLILRCAPCPEVNGKLQQLRFHKSKETKGLITWD